MKRKCFLAAVLLISTVSAVSAQTRYGAYPCNAKARGYYGTPYDGGPQYGSGGGDQYGYGPAYSYAKQAPSRGYYYGCR